MDLSYWHVLCVFVCVCVCVYFLVDCALVYMFKEFVGKCCYSIRMRLSRSSLNTVNKQSTTGHMEHVAHGLPFSVGAGPPASFDDTH